MQNFYALVNEDDALQQKVSMYTKWFHWIMSELTGYNEQDLVGNSASIGVMNTN
jgi:hypothetical protein